ncbi:unnamed protein product [Peniophora sp. CBMAI 1063]|nr:unnamed protein product [Peniophora sp. CBMAI 1063]
MAYKMSSSHVLGGLSYTLRLRCGRNLDADGIYDFSYSLELANAPRNSKKVASAEGHVILRDLLGASGDWHGEMDAPSTETSRLSEMFDSHARLLEDYVRDPYMRGTGVWGHELDKGSILLLTDLDVAQSHRRHGIATWLLQHILDRAAGPVQLSSSRNPSRAKTTTCTFAMAWPASIGSSPEERERRTEIAVKTFRGVGFRRIGRSHFFARVLQDTTHPSLFLAAQEDIKEAASFEDGISTPVANPIDVGVPTPIADSTELGQPTPIAISAGVGVPAPIAEGPPSRYVLSTRINDWAEYARQHPIHAMICDPQYSDADVVRALSKPLTAFECSQICFPDPNHFNATPLHLAAGECRPSVVEKLLSLGAGTSLYSRDTTGLLPVDYAEQALKNAVAVGPLVRGAEENGPLTREPGGAVRCKATLVVAMAQRAASQGDSADVVTSRSRNDDCVELESTAQHSSRDERPTGGCTCGRCSGGWLSPIMLHQIHRCAHAAAEAVRQEMVGLRPDEIRGRTRMYKAFTLEVIPFMEFIPVSIRDAGVYATFIRGYAAVLDGIAELAKSNLIPRPAAVMGQVITSDYFGAQAMHFFLEKGGRVEHALNAVLHTAYTEILAAGDLGPEALNEAHRGGQGRLPRCQNDGNYHLARVKLGIPANMDGPFRKLWRDDLDSSD